MYRIRLEKQYKMPYVAAIAKLEELNSLNSPILKMKALTKVVDLIKKEITDFYADEGIQERCNVNADQILSILIFLIAKGDVRDLLCECEFVKMFAAGNAMASLSGYYLITLEAAVNHIVTDMLDT